MGTDKRVFPLDEVLTVSTGYLVAERHMDAVYDMLNWMTDDSLFTHQLWRASDEVRPRILERHPELAEGELPAFPDMPDSLTPLKRVEAVRAWVAECSERVGYCELELSRLAPEDHTRVHPLMESNIRDKEMIVTQLAD